MPRERRIRTSQPNGEPVAARLQLVVAADARNLARIRRIVGCFAEAVDVPEPLLPDLLLAVNEAVSNVVTHAYDHGGGPVGLRLRAERGRLRVLVRDRGKGSWALRRRGPEVGRGTALMEAVSESAWLARSARGSRAELVFDLTAAGAAQDGSHAGA